MSTQTIGNVNKTLAAIEQTSIVPITASLYDLGSATHPYNNLYANNVVDTGNINTTGIIKTTNATSANSSFAGAITAPNGCLGIGGNAWFGGPV